jgi:heptosyltransferase II
LKSYLIIQTAFIGDVILATSLVETIRQAQPGAQIDVVVRKGNESLLTSNPHIRKVFTWDKKNRKYRGLFRVIREVRQQRYDVILNLQRFASTGFITWRAKAGKKIGFKKNPFAFAFDVKAEHEIGGGKHEIQRNHELLKTVLDAPLQMPKLYPSGEDVKQLQSLNPATKYVVMAPSSVWFTKQLPPHKWVELIKQIPADTAIYLIGGPPDENLVDQIIEKTFRRRDAMHRVSGTPHGEIANLAGKLSLTASALLMRGAQMNYVNDSAPLHLASAMNAPVTAFFCSTVPEFGFGPLSTQSRVQQVEGLACKPCGLHGYKACPLGHFDCGNKMTVIP